MKKRKMLAKDSKVERKNFGYLMYDMVKKIQIPCIFKTAISRF